MTANATEPDRLGGYLVEPVERRRGGGELRETERCRLAAAPASDVKGTLRVLEFHLQLAPLQHAKCGDDRERQSSGYLTVGIAELPVRQARPRREQCNIKKCFHAAKV